MAASPFNEDLHAKLPAGAVSYLEHRAESETLVVLLHGLGLDARDYRTLLKSHPEQHAVALTLQGFEPGREEQAQPVGLQVHAETVSDFLEYLHEEYPVKRIILVGFSLGADLILRLAELWDVEPDRALRLHGAMLLDPNINHSTMSISRLFAAADQDNPLAALKQLVFDAPNMYWFNVIADYAAKVGRKDFSHAQKLSADMLEYWDTEGYDQIGTRLAAVERHADIVRVVVSAPYRDHLQAIRDSVARHGAKSVDFAPTDLEHFDLIEEPELTSQLKQLMPA